MMEHDAKPVARPNPLQRRSRQGLINMCGRFRGIEPVHISESVAWCHRMVMFTKNNGKPRRTVDFHPLNVHATRETHHNPSPFHQAKLVSHDSKKSVLDAWNGYHSVPIYKDDRHLTTFITPWNRYWYTTVPQEFIASGDGYTRWYD